MATCNTQISLTTNSGAEPISGQVEWTDGAGTHVVPINQPYPGTPTTLTLTDVTQVSMTASSSGFNNMTATVRCNGYQQFDLSLQGQGGGGGGGGGGPSGCFVVTAAYGSEAAPEVQMLQAFRDNVLLRTQWGRDFFDRLWKQYFRISPQIADEMRRDPELMRVIRWAVAEPWVNYMKLMLARPDIKGMDLAGLDPKLRAFLLQLQADADAWIKGIELPHRFKGRDPAEAVEELNTVLGLLLLRTGGRAYLDDLESRGELPLQYPPEDEAGLRSALVNAGRTADEVASILYGAKQQ